MSLSRCCRLFGISRQAIYQAEHRYLQREQELAPVKEMVQHIRMDMPRLGTRKLHYLIKEELESREIKMGRDALFDYLRRQNMLVRPKKNYTRTTMSKHWMRKHPNLLQNMDIRRAGVRQRHHLYQKQRTHALPVLGYRCLQQTDNGLPSKR